MERRENNIMGFQSILFGNSEPKLVQEMPEFFKDLHLDYLVDKILEETKGDNIMDLQNVMKSFWCQ